MSWTAPLTWTFKYIPTFTVMNAEIRDRFNLLKTSINDNGVVVGAPPITLTDVASPTDVAIDASLGTTFLLTAAGSRLIGAPSNPTSGQKIVIAIKNTGSGGNRTQSIRTSAGGFRFGTDLPAPGGIVGNYGVLSGAGANLTDYIGAVYNSAAGFWDVLAYMRGF